MPLDPLAPPSLDFHERQVEKHADLTRRVATLERRPMLAAAPWQDAVLENDFGDFLSGYAPVSYYIDGQGRVFLRGVATMPLELPPLTIFTLPAGFRPVYRHAFVTAFPYADSIASAVISISTDGAVAIDEGGAGFGGGCSLDSISFRTL